MMNLANFRPAILVMTFGAALAASAAESSDTNGFTPAQRRFWSLQKVARPAVPQVKAKGQRVNPIPSRGEPGCQCPAVERGSATRKVREPLVNEIAYVAADGSPHEGRQQGVRLPGRGDHQRIAADAVGSSAAAHAER